MKKIIFVVAFLIVVGFFSMPAEACGNNGGVASSHGGLGVATSEVCNDGTVTYPFSTPPSPKAPITPETPETPATPGVEKTKDLTHAEHLAEMNKNKRTTADLEFVNPAEIVHNAIQAFLGALFGK